MLSIRQRLLILQCSTVVAITLFLGALSYSLFIPRIFTLQKNELEHVSREAAQGVGNYLHELVHTLETIDLESFHQRYGDLPLEELFVRHFKDLSGHFPLISYLDEDGQETIRLVDSRPSDYFFDQSEAPVVVAARAEPNQVQVRIAETSPGFDQPALHLAITKIGYFGDQFLGTLLISVPIQRLLDQLEAVLLHEDDGFVSIVDHQRAIYRSSQGPRFEPLASELPSRPGRYQYLGADRFIAFEPVALTGWQVVASRPYGSFISELNKLKMLAGLTCVFVTILSAGLSIRIVRHLTRNISLLIDHAEQVGSGNYEHHLELYQDREFEKLGEAINSMTHAVARAQSARDSLQQIQQSIIDPLVITDQKGLIKQINHATMEMLGCEENSLLGKPLAELFPEPPQMLAEASFSSALLRKRVSNLETYVQASNGKRIAVLFSSSPVPGRNIDMGVVGIMKNIDELVNARIAREHALREAEDAHRRIDALLKSVADGLIVTDLSGKILLYNQPAEQLLGDPRNSEFSATLKDLPEQIQSGPLEPFDISLPASDSSPQRIVQVHSSPVTDHRGSQTGMVSVLRDVTRERALEQIKNEFISTAATELTNPLTSILGYTELLLNREMADNFDPEQKRDFMEEILNRSEFLSKIVDDLINISRIESGQPIPLDIQPADIAPLLTKTVEHFQHFDETHQFLLQLPETAQQPVLIDSNRIKQVLENLLSNAVKYSPAQSSIRISGEYTVDSYKIQIVDQGVGMSEEQLAQVFDKFYRCDNNTAQNGLGLGMSIVQQIVDRHQGSIQIDSKPGEGTTVTLLLPLAEAD